MENKIQVQCRNILRIETNSKKTPHNNSKGEKPPSKNKEKL